MISLRRGFASSSGKSSRILSLDKINQSVVRADYAVRGAIPMRAEELRVSLSRGNTSLPFSSITNCNIGNPQQLQQQPITFFRQVSALVEYPELIAKAKGLFPDDAIERAQQILDSCGGNIGAYSHSQGIPSIRENVARFIQSRDDGYAADPTKIFLTAGASQGVMHILQTLVANDSVGVMIPIPQYPLYTAALALNNARPVPYYLNEQDGWSLSIDELKRSIGEARQGQNTNVRALCIINPGNPTGNTLSIDNMREVIQFCIDERLVLLADEVYQANIYQPQRKPFHSFKKVAKQMKADSQLEMVSFHSISKGVSGECGRRGGYFELFNIDPEVVEQIYKLASISLCPPVQGQVMVDLMVQPPQLGKPSYEMYAKETSLILESLKRRALKLQEAFNRMEGYSCQEAEGAMYLFPTITLPASIKQVAAKRKMTPDAFYCMEMLEATGVCVVPGSGFGQKEGTFHFRSTFLPPEEVFDEFIDRIDKFHRSFMLKYKASS